MGHYQPLLPDLILAMGATLILLLGPLRDGHNLRDFLRWVSLAIVGGATATLIWVNHGVAPPYPLVGEGWLTSAPLHTAFAVVFLATIAWTILASTVPDEDAGEWYSMLLFLGTGMIILARAANLAAVFLGLEVLSISLYILIAFRYAKRSSLRGGIMYLILAGFASGFLLFGMALIYAVFGTMQIGEIRSMAMATDMAPMALVGFGLFLVGVGFKLAAVPFHMWTPEVYESSPGTVTGLIASSSKGAMLAAFIPFMFLLETHWRVIWLFAVLSMIGGNLLGLREIRVKRILAYSSIAHIGYVLTGYLAGDTLSVGAAFLPSITGINAVFFYVVAYAASILGAFAALGYVQGDRDLTLRDLRGVGRRNPVIAFCLLIFVWSLAGLPPAVGFFGKIYLFSAAVNAGYFWLPLIGLLGSAIGIYYYLRIIVHLFMMPADASDPKVHASTLQEWVMLGSAAAVIALGIFPESVFGFLRAF